MNEMTPPNELAERVRSLWADYELLHFSPPALSELGMSPGDEAVLRIGMPREVGSGAIFVARELEMLTSSGGSRFARFGVGAYGQCDICVDLDSGAVVNPFVNGQEELDSGYYVNRDVTVFLEFLCAMERYARLVASDPGRQVLLDEVKTVRANLCLVDEAALAPDAWWTGTVEEMDMV
jgi:hypothetical protein